MRPSVTSAASLLLLLEQYFDQYTERAALAK